MERVAYLSILALEPLAIRSSYGTGGFYSASPYIPSSTVSGALLSEYFRSKGFTGLSRSLIWSSHAFPGEPPKLGEPPAISPRTLSRAEDGKIISSARKLASAVRSGPDILRELRNLDPKVGNVFLKPDGSKVDPPKRRIETHVALDYKWRTHASVSGNSATPGAGREVGLLFTQEILEAGSKFHALCFLSEGIFDFIKGGLEVKLGSMRNKGYGLARIDVSESDLIDNYVEKRISELSKRSGEEWLFMDVLNFLRSGSIARLGDPVYQKTFAVDTKFWHCGKFHLYRNLYGTGSVFVFDNPMRLGKMTAENLAKIETSPPQDPVDSLHGIDMVFFDNPIHLVDL